MNNKYLATLTIIEAQKLKSLETQYETIFYQVFFGLAAKCILVAYAASVSI